MTLHLGKFDDLTLDTKYEYKYCMLVYIKSSLYDPHVVQFTYFNSLFELEKGYKTLVDALEGRSKWVNTEAGVFRVEDIEHIAPVVAYNVPSDEFDEGTYKRCLDFDISKGDVFDGRYNHIKHVPIDLIRASERWVRE